MAWQCVMYEIRPMGEMELDRCAFRLLGSSDPYVPFKDLPVGAMYIDWDDLLCVKLPGGPEWIIDRHDRKWTRTGEPPNVTVTPSINHQGVYHGWLTNGALTDDVDGRVFS